MSSEAIDPPDENFSFSTLKEYLTNLCKVINQHSQVHNQILTTLNDELKLRPTFSELQSVIQGNQSTSAVPVNNEVMVEKVNSELSNKIDRVMQSAESQFQEYRHEVENVNNLLLDTRQNYNRSIRKNKILCDKALQCAEAQAGRLFRKWRLKKFHECWKEYHMYLKRRRGAVKQILAKRVASYRTYWFKFWKHQIRRSDNQLLQDKVNSMNEQIQLLIPQVEQNIKQIEHLQANKTDIKETEIIQRKLKRKDVNVIFDDMKGILLREVKLVAQEIKQHETEVLREVKNLKNQVVNKAELSDIDKIIEIVQNAQQKADSLEVQQILVNEKLAKTDYVNKVEDTQFQIELLHRQFNDLKANTINNQKDKKQSQTYFDGFQSAKTTTDYFRNGQNRSVIIDKSFIPPQSAPGGHRKRSSQLSKLFIGNEENLFSKQFRNSSVQSRQRTASKSARVKNQA